VPHISLVFREIWETTEIYVRLSEVGKKVKARGLPHLAKNERDMGHPTILGRDGTLTEKSVSPASYLAWAAEVANGVAA
jgi:hypothetical protein